MHPTDALRLASDLTTPAEQLEPLMGFAKRREVGQALARNPNLPAPLVAKLLCRYTDAALENPALSLIALESPLFLNTLSREVLLSVLQNPRLPQYLLVLLETHPDKLIVQAARLHQSAGSAQSGWEADVVSLIAQLPSTPWLRFCYHSRGLFPEWLWSALPSSEQSGALPYPCYNQFYSYQGPQTPDPTPLTADEIKGLQPTPELICTTNRTALLAHLARRRNWKVTLNPHCPPEALAELAEVGSRALVLQWCVLSHPNTPLEILMRHATEDDCVNAIALNSCAPRELLEQLLPKITHIDPRNALTTEQLLTRWRELTQKRLEQTGFDSALLQRTDCPLESWLAILETISENKDLAGFLNRLHTTSPQKIRTAARATVWQQRLATALNPRIEQITLEILSGDANRYVRIAAQSRLDDPSWRFMA
jgi:hypothetical protein